MITSSISQAERMLTEFDGTCGYIGLQLNLHKTVFKRNLWVSDALFTLNGTNISECTNYVYLSRELNMMNDLTAEPAIREETPPGCSEEDQAALCSPLQHHRTSCFDLCFRNPGISHAGRKRWASLNAQLRVMHGVSRFTQVRDGIRRSLLRQRSKIRDAAAFVKESKIRWAGHVMRFNDNRWTRAVSDWATRDIKRTTGRPPDGQTFSRTSLKKDTMVLKSFARRDPYGQPIRVALDKRKLVPARANDNGNRNSTADTGSREYGPPARWSDFFTKFFEENYDVLRVPCERRTN